MFGFIRSGNDPEKTAPPVVHTDTILVSKEDIYRENKGMEPILLLRKGYEVTQEELPRFIRNGAKPHQFQFKNSIAQAAAIPAPKPARSTYWHTNLIHRRTPTEAKPAAYKQSKTVLILDSDQKSMKRLIDCLFICGIHLDHIHPVRVSEHLRWTLEKYQPQILIIDYHLSGSQNGLQTLATLAKQPCLEKIILTVSPHPKLSEQEQWALQNFCQKNHIPMLTKPISRHTLNKILQD